MNGALTVQFDSGPDQPARRDGLFPIGLLVVIATVAMLFAAFTASVLIRSTGPDWVPVHLPGIVWGNTLLIVLSSVALEGSRWVVRREGDRGLAVSALAIAGVLGLFFLAGQGVAWIQLNAAGVFLPTSPHASFFYMLSAVHGAHVVGGIGSLLWTLGRLNGGAYSAVRYRGLDHAAIYWHFVGAVWVYLAVLLTNI